MEHLTNMLFRRNMVYKLKKVIYELKQNPRALFEKFSTITTGIGFQRCHYDRSVFVLLTTSRIALFAIYVDDIRLSGSNIRVLNKMKDYLKQYFVTMKMEKLRYFLEIEVAYKRTDCFFLRESMQ